MTPEDADNAFAILIKRIYRLLVLVEAGRAGIDAQSVLDLKGRAHPKGFQQTGAVNGCRQLALYMAHTSFGVPLKPLARAAGISPQAVSRICHKIEDARSDAGHDLWLSNIEAVLNG